MAWALAITWAWAFGLPILKWSPFVRPFIRGADTYSWLWKAVLTVVTLSLGFKGGEVTPLFFIGATLGNSLAISLGLPVDWLAGLGMVAVFAAATMRR